MGAWFLSRRDAHCGIPTPADPNSRLTIWVYRWPSSWSNCRASRKAATGSLSYAVRRASFSQYETPGSARISLRFILTFTARVSINLDTDSASSRNRLPSPTFSYLLLPSPTFSNPLRFVLGCYSGWSATSRRLLPPFILFNPGQQPWSPMRTKNDDEDDSGKRGRDVIFLMAVSSAERKSPWEAKAERASDARSRRRRRARLLSSPGQIEGSRTTTTTSTIRKNPAAS